MNRTLSSFALALLLLGAGAHAALASDKALPPLPPLNDPATDAQLPGKFIWADIFTSDVSGVRQFYGQLFGWNWRWISEQPDRPYGMFYANGIAVAGVAHRDAPDGDKTYARWVYYISTRDVEKAVRGAAGLGGRTLLPRRSIAHRGDFAVLADPEGAPFGVLHSSSGDPPDFRAEVGEWIWVDLFSRDAAKASKFYESLFPYAAREWDVRPDVVELVLEASGHARGGIGQLSPESEAKPTWLGFVRVADLEAALEKARAAGGEVLYAPEDEDLKGDLAIIADPFGAPVGLLKWTFEGDEAEAEPQP
jgi:predicted enzyme related to lactoylglutathione lyase